MPAKKRKKLWYPTLLQSATSVPSNSWFNILQKTNPSKCNCNISTINTTYISTRKYLIYPSNEQHNKLQTWFKAVIDMYNITNLHIKNKYNKTKKVDTFITLRKELLDKAQEMCKSTRINKHILDYSIKHCCSMYQAALSNLVKGNITTFDIKDIEHNRNRYQLVLEQASFSKKKNGFCIKELGEMKYQRNFLPLKESILQYNKKRNKYYIIVPIEKEMKTNMERQEKCGIDMGVRTFTTVYSPNETYEIGTNLYGTIDTYNSRIDTARSCVDNNLISKYKFQKVVTKYGEKMRNRVDDMHKKISVFLCRKFDIINLEKVSIKNMISNLTGTLRTNTKRRLAALSIYKFYERIEIVSKRYGTKINLINAWRTSKNCCECGNTHENLGSSKIYKCSSCKIELDRDINAAINMYNGGFKSV